MKALVTGGLGFIGSTLCKKLVEEKWDVHIVDDLSTGYKENLVKGAEWTRWSLGTHSTEQLFKIIGEVDVIFHLAAVPRVTFSVEHPYESAKANIMGTLAALEYSRHSKNKPRVIFSSSSSVYGGSAQLPTPETEPVHPRSPYALEKWQGEEWCRAYSKLYDLDVVCLRYFNVFGSGSRYGGSYSTVLSAWLYSTLVDTKLSPYIEGDGFQTRDFCHCDNVVQANILAAKHKEKFNGDVFNIAQGQTRSLLDCKIILEDIYGKTFELEQRPTRVGDVRDTWADISKAQKILGYNPDTDFKGQLKKMADWYKEFYKV